MRNTDRKDFELVVEFVDTIGVADAQMRGTSNTISLRRMLQMFIEIERQPLTSSWIARVPSPSNPADGPSR